MAEALAVRRIDHEVVITEGPAHATQLARQATADGTRVVVAVGGDGTLHEVVNGVVGDGDAAPADTVVGLLPAGRGSDYARGLGLDASPMSMAARLAGVLEGDPAATRRVDLGEVTYRPTETVAGRPATDIDADAADDRARRIFINEAGIGFSPFVAQRTARFPARFGEWLYTLAGIVTIIDWRHRTLELTWDGEGRQDDRPDASARYASVEVALGRYAGGGMLLAPGAVLDDRLFDVVTIGEAGRGELLSFSWRLRSGAHLGSPVVTIRRASSLAARVVDDGGPVYLQADGELLGRDPVTFRVLPDALVFAG
jgi:YegS/Rv2252/BmrU family lipid kinase